MINVGDKFGRLTVLENSGRGKFLCSCACGSLKSIKGWNLLHSFSRSCGCLRAIVAKQKATIHGKSRTPEYNAYFAMKNRCYDPQDNQFHNYGARGIRVCERWLNSPSAFLSDMGPRPAAHSLDRINNDGNYEPENCRWANDKQQARNQRRSKLSEAKAAQIRELRARGWKYKELADHFGVSEGSIGFVLSGEQWAQSDTRRMSKVYRGSRASRP